MAYIEMSYKSDALTREVQIQVILPSHEGFGDGMYPCKTLYLLHGFNGNGAELTRFLPLMVQSMIKGMAIVLCDGDNSFYADKKDGISNYRKFVEEEMVKVTRSLFPLSHLREDTFIGGISMGGHGALVSGFSQTNTFSKIAVLSPCINFYEVTALDETPFTEAALDPIFGSREQYENSDQCCECAAKKAMQDDKIIPDIFIGCGKQDPLIYGQQRRFAEWLKEKNIPVVHREIEGSHDIFLWRDMLDEMFAFLAE